MVPGAERWAGGNCGGQYLTAIKPDITSLFRPVGLLPARGTIFTRTHFYFRVLLHHPSIRPKMGPIECFAKLISVVPLRVVDLIWANIYSFTLDSTFEISSLRILTTLKPTVNIGWGYGSSGQTKHTDWDSVWLNDSASYSLTDWLTGRSNRNRLQQEIIFALG